MQAARPRTSSLTLAALGGRGELYTGGTYVPVALTSQRRPRGVSSAKVRCRFMLEIPRFLEILVQAPTPPHSSHPTLCVLAPGSLHNRARSVLSSVAFVPVSVQGGKLKTGLRFCSAPSLGSEGGLAGKEGGVPSPKPFAEDQTRAQSLLQAPSAPRRGAPPSGTCSSPPGGHPSAARRLACCLSPGGTGEAAVSGRAASRRGGISRPVCQQPSSPLCELLPPRRAEPTPVPGLCVSPFPMPGAVGGLAQVSSMVGGSAVTKAACCGGEAGSPACACMLPG